MEFTTLLEEGVTIPKDVVHDDVDATDARRAILDGTNASLAPNSNEAKTIFLY